MKPLDSKAHGAGWYHCNACRKLFTVRVGSVMERSHIPLTKWALVFHLMAASKKGVSAKQVQRMCGFKSYKSAWFMCHRIREAMKPDASAGPLGGAGKVLESMRPSSAARRRTSIAANLNPRSLLFTRW